MAMTRGQASILEGDVVGSVRLGRRLGGWRWSATGKSPTSRDVRFCVAIEVIADISVLDMSIPINEYTTMSTVTDDTAKGQREGAAPARC
jgi:hypothetical protein